MFSLVGVEPLYTLALQARADRAAGKSPLGAHDNDFHRRQICRFYFLPVLHMKTFRAVVLLTSFVNGFLPPLHVIQGMDYNRRWYLLVTNMDEKRTLFTRVNGTVEVEANHTIVRSVVFHTKTFSLPSRRTRKVAFSWTIPDFVEEGNVFSSMTFKEIGQSHYINTSFFQKNEAH